MQVQGRRAWGVVQAGRAKTLMLILKFYFIFCNCPINRQGPNLSTANQPVYMQDMESLYISGHVSRAIAFSSARWPRTLFPRACEILAVLQQGWPELGTRPWLVQPWRSCHPGMSKHLKSGRARIVLLLFANAPFLKGHTVAQEQAPERSTQTPIKS